MRRGLAATGIAILLVLAGCSGLPGGSETPTLSPASVPADDATYPPGTSAAGVQAPLVLAEAHYDSLYRQPYHVVRVRTVRYRNGSLYSRRLLDATLAGNRSRFAITLTAAGPGVGYVPGPPTTERLWSDGDVLAYWLTVGNESTRELLPAAAFSQRAGPFDRRPAAVRGLAGTDREAYLLFRAVAVDTSRTANGSVVVDGSRLVRPAALAQLQGVREPANATLDARIGPGGLLTRYHLTYDATIGDRRFTVVQTVHYRDVGTATVAQPEWVRRLRANGTVENP